MGRKWFSIIQSFLPEAAVSAETSPLDTDRKLAAIDNNDMKKDNTCSTLITDNINEPANEQMDRRRRLRERYGILWGDY